MQKTAGVFARRMHKIAEQPFGGQTPVFEKLAREGNELDLSFHFFSVETWEAGEKIIDALQFENEQWTHKRVPIPSIVFDRFFSNKKLRPAATSFRRFLKENNTTFTTPIALSQLTGNKLSSNMFYRNHNIPHLKTYSFRNIKEGQLQALFSQNRKVYLKPFSGLQGKGIVVVEKLKWYQGWRKVRVHPRKGEPVVLSANQLRASLAEYKNFNRYIVQPDANAYGYESSPVCLRILLQNRGNKDYAATGTIARVGAPKAWLAVPGPEERAIPLQDMVDYHQRVHNIDISEDAAAVEQLCVTCANKLDKEYGSFLELGFDVMLTKDKGPIVLEINTKPGRTLFGKMADSYPKGSEEWVRHKQIERETVRRPALFINSLFS